MIIFLGFAFLSISQARQQMNSFGQLFNVKVHPPPAQDKALRGQHRINQSVFDFSLLCADGIPLLMEDHKPRPCQPRPWLVEQKCPTGFWCHEGSSEGSFYCCPNSRKFANRCHLPPAVGYGKQRMRRFYFDWKTDACHELQYSGIGGNENSFMDYEKCENACRGAGEPPISLPSNMKEKKITKKVSMVYEIPTTTAEITSSESTTSSTTTTTTISPTTTTTEPLDPNPCILAPDRGHAGSEAIRMWYFDTASLSCSPFLYLGSSGNSNRFETPEECINTCGIGKPNRKSCDLPPVIGNGPFNIPRYYFDKNTMRCERFFYSGRDGNSNRFFKKTKCEKLCLRKKPKKKENIYSTSTTPFTVELTPMRIVQKLKPLQESTPSNTWNQHQQSQILDSTTESYKNNAVTVEGFVERSSTVQNLQEFEFTTKTHPTLINQPIGEIIPTILPPTTPDVADNLFASLMTSQQRKIDEMETNGKHETTILNPSTAPDYGSSHSIANSYGMKIEPYGNVIYPQPANLTAGYTTISKSTEQDYMAESGISSPTSNKVITPETTTIPESFTQQNTSTIEISTTIAPTTTPIATTTHHSSTTILSSTLPHISIIPEVKKSFVFPIPRIEQPIEVTTSTTPIPTLLPPNISEIISSNFPCLRSFYGEPTIRCESRVELCPMGTFCQIGQGQSMCCPILDVPPCDQEIEEGVGSSLIRRWYFDPTTRLCQPFYFKGFKGNQNNFQSFDDCNRACGATNICPIGVPHLSLHTHLLSCTSSLDCPLSYQCVQSTPHNLCCAQGAAPIQMSTPTSQNPFQLPTNMVLEFLPSSPCEQPIDVGFGGFSEHRWAFNNGHCISFLYRGQGGNMNNYLTRNDCIINCQNSVSSEKNHCTQAAASGHGDQYLSRYFYSPEYRQCLHFIYSGEGGNENNFESLNECLEVCVANGVKFSSLLKNSSPVVPAIPAAQNNQFEFKPRIICPQGSPLITVSGIPIQCDYEKAAKCPGDHVCTPNGKEAYCCPSPMNFCLQTRPAISVCTEPDFYPIKEIRFTYDPLSDRCIRFNFQNCRGAEFTSRNGLNNFISKSQCNRLCCNQGYNLVYKRRLLTAMNDEPISD